MPGGAANNGWTSYAPLSSVPVYSGVNMGQNLWCISLIVLAFLWLAFGGAVHPGANTLVEIGVVAAAHVAERPARPAIVGVAPLRVGGVHDRANVDRHQGELAAGTQLFH